MRLFISFAILLSGMALPAYAQSAALERGVAVTDPLALRELDLREHHAGGLRHAGFGIGRMFDPANATDAPMRNNVLFGLPSMAPVRKALDSEFDRYLVKHQSELPAETIGVGPSFDFQLFDRDALYSSRSRFVLAGIVNRMDRAYVSPDTCGEIRLLYRLTRVDRGNSGETITPRRLPMTLNVVLKAKSGKSSIICAEIARRWLGIADVPQTGAELATKLASSGGPLELIRPEDVFRIETNLQIAHASKSAVRDFRTDYLMKVFDYDAQSRSFKETTLENQIDRDRLLADRVLGQEFKRWLLDPRQIGELDRGTIVLPEKFLTKGAVAPTPAGFAKSNLQPAFGLMQSDDTGAGIFSESEVVAALRKATQRGVVLQNTRSPAGFERRLNDMTCAGCHQTRGIGGFHFPGVDWMATKPDNSIVVPASPHFFGDQVRRRDILTAVRDGHAPDYSRGFSDRPQLRGSKELLGTEYYDGWGAHCYDGLSRASANDRSFRSWSCAKGLSCQMIGNAEKSGRMGMCFVGSH